LTNQEVLTSITPFFHLFRRRSKRSPLGSTVYISQEERTVIKILDEVFNIKSKNRKLRIAKNTIIILHQIFISCNNFPPKEDKILDRITEIMPD
jgi:hypothetical protein